MRSIIAMKNCPQFDKFSDQLDDYGKKLLQRGSVVSLPANSPIFKQGDNCSNYILVLDGSVKVFSRNQHGREIVLYRVKKGESCTLTTSCLLADNRYPAESITETEVSALLISAKDFNNGLERSDKFRQFVFSAYGNRIKEVITLVETVSFGRIDVRLASALIEEAGELRFFKITHQQLAIDLGTAREVVSRHLKEFERRGWLKLSRGSVELVNFNAIEDLALN